MAEKAVKKQPDDELEDVLIAISVVAKRLARKLRTLDAPEMRGKVRSREKGSLTRTVYGR